MVELIQMNGIIQAHSINKKKKKDMLTNLYIHLILIIIIIKKIYVHFGPPTIILNLISFNQIHEYEPTL